MKTLPGRIHFASLFLLFFAAATVSLTLGRADAQQASGSNILAPGAEFGDFASKTKIPGNPKLEPALERIAVAARADVANGIRLASENGIKVKDDMVRVVVESASADVSGVVSLVEAGGPGLRQITCYHGNIE